MTGSRNSGFTLVELLIGLALLGFLSLLMLSGLEITSNAWRHVDARATAGRELESAQDLLRDRLSQVYPAVVSDDDGNHTVDFAGRADAIEFVAPLPERFGARVLVRFRLHLDDGTLRLGWSLPGNAETDSDSPAEASVLGNLSDVAILYYGVDDPAAPAHWQSSWLGRKSLPLLIRVHLARNAPETAAWPDLVIAPLVSADAQCVFDPSDGACRGL
jgi:general secretion pathway protein J